MAEKFYSRETFSFVFITFVLFLTYWYAIYYIPGIYTNVFHSNDDQNGTCNIWNPHTFNNTDDKHWDKTASHTYNARTNDTYYEAHLHSLSTTLSEYVLHLWRKLCSCESFHTLLIPMSANQPPVTMATFVFLMFPVCQEYPTSSQPPRDFLRTL